MGLCATFNTRTSDSPCSEGRTSNNAQTTERCHAWSQCKHGGRCVVVYELLPVSATAGAVRFPAPKNPVTGRSLQARHFYRRRIYDQPLRCDNLPATRRARVRVLGPSRNAALCSGSLPFFFSFLRCLGPGLRRPSSARYTFSGLFPVSSQCGRVVS